MRHVVLGTLLAIVAAAGGAQAQDAAYRAPRNGAGQPEFQGVWSLNSLTRLERPRTIANLVLTEQEANTLIPAPILPSDGVGTAETESYDTFNLGWARLGKEVRSSWLIEPKDGRLPYSPAGDAKMRRQGAGANDNPEGRSTYERCLSMPQGGPPMLNAAYNNNIEFVQTKDHVAIRQEANHEVRIIYLKDKSVLNRNLTQWMGHSVGRFDGDTLVVETVGFSPSHSDRRSAMTRVYMSPGAKVTERFTRISKSQIKYEFEVVDPEVFSAPWKGEIPLTYTTEPTFEYACHEGNYGLQNILSGARYEEGVRTAK